MVIYDNRYEIENKFFKSKSLTEIFFQNSSANNFIEKNRKTRGIIFEFK